MDRFLDCLCDGNLQSLAVDNAQVPQNELEAAWIVLLNEYHELKGNIPKGQSLVTEIKRLQNHLNLLDQCIFFLEMFYSEHVVDVLRKMGYTFKPKTCNPDDEDYRNGLQAILNRSQTKVVYLKQKVKELEDYLKNAGDGKPKRSYFENLLIHIEQVQHVSYSMETIKVSKFITLEEHYWKVIDAKNVKNA